MNNPKISVVIPTYKRPDKLCRAIDSVLLQDYVDYELIVVDDNGLGSDAQNETERILKQKYKDYRIRYIPNTKSLGGGGARNTGVTAAKGEYIAFLDDDEDWLPGKLTKQIDIIRKRTHDTGVIDTGVNIIGSDGKIKYRSPDMHGWIFDDLISKSDKNAPKLSTMLCRKTCLEEAGLFDPEFKSRQDLDLYLRLSRICKFESIDEPLSNKRIDAETRISTNILSKLQGYEKLHIKYIEEFKKRPEAHSEYLFQYAYYLFICSHPVKAIFKVVEACYLLKFNPRKIIGNSLRLFKKIWKYSKTKIRYKNKKKGRK